jgi:hypothetical protein
MAAPLRTQLFDEALQILQNLQQTKYVHADPTPEAASAGIFDTDCSGFVNYILGVVARNHLNQIPQSGSPTRSLAEDYYAFLSNLPNQISNGWRQIEYLADAQPGDLIAWPLPLSSGDTGHVFVVAQQPIPLDSETMAVPAYDSSDILHYDDSRSPGPAQPRQTGVGSGTFHLTISADGIPTAFQFGPGDNVRSDSIAIGRIEFFDA